MFYDYFMSKVHLGEKQNLHYPKRQVPAQSMIHWQNSQ